MESSNNSSNGSSPHEFKSIIFKKKPSVMKRMTASPKNDSKKSTAVRVGERRKRAKKVFDPSENNVPSKRKRGRPVGSLNKTTIKKQASLMSISRNPSTFDGKSKTESMESSNEDTNDSQSLNSSSNKGGICVVCRRHRSMRDNSEKLIGCRDCSNKAHTSCLKGDDRQFRLRPDNTWVCPPCATCVVCIETRDAGHLNMCNVCLDSYHPLCHSPIIPESERGWCFWECSNCQSTKNSEQALDGNYIDKVPSSDRSSKQSDRSDSITLILDRRREQRKDKTITKNNNNDEKSEKTKPFYNEKERSYSPLTVTTTKWKSSMKVYSSTSETRIKEKENLSLKQKLSILKKKSNVENGNTVFMDNHDFNKFCGDSLSVKHPHYSENEQIDPSIPDVLQWTSLDVYNYFFAYFPEHAHIFTEQKIDGMALMMMKRLDVLNHLNVELGPALKIYKHIVKLQCRRDDMKMCWF